MAASVRSLSSHTSLPFPACPRRLPSTQKFGQLGVSAVQVGLEPSNPMDSKRGEVARRAFLATVGTRAAKGITHAPASASSQGCSRLEPVAPHNKDRRLSPSKPSAELPCRCFQSNPAKWEGHQQARSVRKTSCRGKTLRAVPSLASECVSWPRVTDARCGFPACWRLPPYGLAVRIRCAGVRVSLSLSLSL